MLDVIFIFHLELCLTSNIQCKTVSTYESHQFKYLYEVGHPICLGVSKIDVSKHLSK